MTDLAEVLALLRAIGGARRYSAVYWSGDGYRYSLTASAMNPMPVVFDADPTAPGLEDDEAALTALLDVPPPPVDP
jgi:hypothetical protein